jgi:hypothetical protein
MNEPISERAKRTLLLLEAQYAKECATGDLSHALVRLLTDIYHLSTELGMDCEEHIQEAESLFEMEAREQMEDLNLFFDASSRVQDRDLEGIGFRHTPRGNWIRRMSENLFLVYVNGCMVAIDLGDFDDILDIHQLLVAVKGTHQNACDFVEESGYFEASELAAEAMAIIKANFNT